MTIREIRTFNSKIRKLERLSEQYLDSKIKIEIENKKLKQKLKNTRKALELAITGLKNCKTRDHIGAVCRTPEYVDNILEQITALTKGDDNE